MAKKDKSSGKDDAKTVILGSSGSKQKPESEAETHILRKTPDHDTDQAETVKITREARGSVQRGPSKSASGQRDSAPAPRDEGETVFAHRKPEAKGQASSMATGSQGDEAAAENWNPVSGWLVVVSGPGKGSYKPVFSGRNRLGRSASADISLDFGDQGISKEQAIIHYDPEDRSFLFIPEMDVQHFPQLNGKKVTKPAPLKANAEIMIAETTMRFVPFCGPNFSWDDVDSK